VAIAALAIFSLWKSSDYYFKKFLDLDLRVDTGHWLHRWHFVILLAMCIFSVALDPRLEHPLTQAAVAFTAATAAVFGYW
jgi:hypothetical protein